MEKLLVTGANGQLGRTFLQYFAESNLSRRYVALPCDRHNMDLRNEKTVRSFLSTHQPSMIINCGGYTAVDKAEVEPEIAQKVNSDAVAYISMWASKNKCRVIHISTDFIFDGRKSRPYLTTDPAHPSGVYGKTKLEGEKQIKRILPRSGVIIRTSWLYSEYRNNFVKTMIKLMEKESSVGVVSDQIGSPTSTHSLVALILKVIEKEGFYGVLHWCDGACISWYDFALEIQRQAVKHGILKRKTLVKPIVSSEYKTLAVRPPYSVLSRGDTIRQFPMTALDWKMELNEVLGRIYKRAEI